MFRNAYRRASARAGRPSALKLQMLLPCQATLKRSGSGFRAGQMPWHIETCESRRTDSSACPGRPCLAE